MYFSETTRQAGCGTSNATLAAGLNSCASGSGGAATAGSEWLRPQISRVTRGGNRLDAARLLLWPARTCNATSVLPDRRRPLRSDAPSHRRGGRSQHRRHHVRRHGLLATSAATAARFSTPNLDALAAGGLRFTQFYNTARCCPTRASLLTGLYPHQAGIGHMMDDKGLDGYRGDLNRRCVTIAEVLQPAGYRTLRRRQVARHAARQARRPEAQLAAAARLRPLLRHDHRRAAVSTIPAR